MDYGNILSRAWQITWKHKVLWVFGVLVAITSGGGSGSGGGNSGTNGGNGRDFSGSLPPEVQRFIDSPTFWITILAIICILFIIGIVLFLLGVAATGALIGGINLAETTGSVTFAQAWSIGTKNFLKILGLKITVGILNAIAAIISIICCPLLCIYIPAAIILPVFLNYAYFAIVLEDQGVFDSLRRAWDVLKTNITSTIVLGLIMFAIGVAFGIILLIPFGIAVLPAFYGVMQNTRSPNMYLIAATGVAFLCLIPIAILLSGIVTTWTTATWQLAYRQFTGGTTAPNTTTPQIPPSQEPPTLMTA